MIGEPALTDAGYWDSVWARAPEARRLSPRDPHFGTRGRFMRMVDEHLGNLEGKRVLEVGGGGVNYRLLALHAWGGAQVTAVDYSEIGLRVLRSHRRRDAPRLPQLWRMAQTGDMGQAHHGRRI